MRLIVFFGSLFLFFGLANNVNAGVVISQPRDEFDSSAFLGQLVVSPDSQNTSRITSIKLKLKYLGGCPGPVSVYVAFNSGINTLPVDVTSLSTMSVVEFFIPEDVNFPASQLTEFSIRQSECGGQWRILSRGAVRLPDEFWYRNLSDPGQNLWFEIYDSGVETPTRNPVLIIPGIMGTEVSKGEDLLWANITRLVSSADDSFMDPLSFSPDGSPVDMSLVFTKVINEKTIAGTEVYNYSGALINELGLQDYTEGRDLFTFPYDWREDVRKIAIENNQQSLPPEQRTDLQGKIEWILQRTGAQKVDIVAHSQGGLVIKSLLASNPIYEQKVGKLIFVGTPHLGAPKAAKALLYGDDMGVNAFGMGLDPEELKRIGRNMPAVYNLLPGRQYFNHYPKGYLGGSITSEGNIFRGLNFSETKTRLAGNGLHTTLIDNSDTFHSTELDNFDLSGTSMSVFNIVGCEEGTITEIFQRPGGKYKLGYGAGDGTVPIKSASNVYGAQTYYARSTNHGVMMTDDGIRQLITNIVSGSVLEVPAGQITGNAYECRYNGRVVEVHSPVTMHIYDEFGNHNGPDSIGNIEVQIPGSQYDIVGHEKFSFLPVDGEYTVKFIGEDVGTFDFYSSEIVEGEEFGSVYFHKVPVTQTTTATLALTEGAGMQLDNNGDTVPDVTVLPSAVLSSNQANDFRPPTTNIVFNGLGNGNRYKSDVTVTAQAVDVGDENNKASGVLKTYHRLNTLAWQEYTAPVSIQAEGVHTIQFYSVDNIGNEEPVQEVTFTIDRTAPEIRMQFGTTAQDLVFTAIDNLDPQPVIFQNTAMVSARDSAGNITELHFIEQSRKFSLKADIAQLSYNGVLTDVSNLDLLFQWQKSGRRIISLNQHVRTKFGFNVLAKYDGKYTKIKGNRASGVSTTVIPGLALLTVTTNKGDLEWGY